MNADYVQGIERSDTTVFKLLTQSSECDRRTLLDIQNIVRTFDSRYVYLEVGSHLGGTLLPHLMDPLCRSVISVDPRPQSQEDERGRVFHYERNSTARMIRNLETVVLRHEMTKLRTFDSDMSELSLDDIKDKVRIAFIDGEHTNRACFRDFLSVLPVMQDDAAILFHDANLIFDALCNIEEYLKRLGRPFCSMYLPDAVFAVGLGEMAARVEEKRLSAFEHEEYINHARAELQRTALENRPEFRELHEQIEALRLQKRTIEETLESKVAGYEATVKRIGNDASAREKALRQRLVALENSLQRATAEIEALKRSTSWRITAPVRMLGSMLGRATK